MRLVKLTAENRSPVYVNPEFVFAVGRDPECADNTLIEGTDEACVVVKEPLEYVVEKLTNPITVDLPYLKPGQKVTITSNTDEEIIIKAPANVTHKDGDAVAHIPD